VDNQIEKTQLSTPPNRSNNRLKIGREDQLRRSVWALRNEGLLSPLIPTAQNGLGGGQRASRSPGALRLHPAFNQLNLAGWLINSESRGKPRSSREPILVTRRAILISGFADWHAAVCAGQTEIDCTEFELDDDEALQLILSLHRPRGTWNDFTRTELALQQVIYFQSKAFANQIAGGKRKGLANLPKAEHIDVRGEIAKLAGVSSRTVGNVKIILKKAHQCLVEALHGGMITIHRALQLCQTEKDNQVEMLARFLAERLNSKTNREFIGKLRLEKLSANIGSFLARLQQLEAQEPGSIEVRPGTREKTVILMGKRHLNEIPGTLEASLP
jgi:hypothetical protein